MGLQACGQRAAAVGAIRIDALHRDSPALPLPM
jgi:hypothetical protein